MRYLSFVIDKIFTYILPRFYSHKMLMLLLFKFKFCSCRGKENNYHLKVSSPPLYCSPPMEATAAEGRISSIEGNTGSCAGTVRDVTLLLSNEGEVQYSWNWGGSMDSEQASPRIKRAHPPGPGVPPLGGYSAPSSRIRGL